jgi:hypothetical protein
MRLSPMILVCHATDGRFADGDRDAVRSILTHSPRIMQLAMIEAETFWIRCRDGGQLALSAPGLDRARSFHHMGVSVAAGGWTADSLHLLFDLMRLGGFGLVDDIDTPHFIVTDPQQVRYFPWLPEPPLVVRSSDALGFMLMEAVA